jgi:hypothetical protein
MISSNGFFNFLKGALAGEHELSYKYMVAIASLVRYGNTKHE